MLANNPGMLKLMRSLGFTIKTFPEDEDFLLRHARLVAAALHTGTQPAATATWLRPGASGR